jgi:hypothetical protein
MGNLMLVLSPLGHEELADPAPRDGAVAHAGLSSLGLNRSDDLFGSLTTTRSMDPDVFGQYYRWPEALDQVGDSPQTAAQSPGSHLNDAPVDETV